MKKFDFIDALRGIAVFSVLIVHVSQYVENLPVFVRRITLQGQYGVQLFYLISALTLFISLETRKYKENNLYVNFFIRRFFRIAPLFYCSIAFYLIFNGLGPRYWLGDEQSITLFNIVSHFLFINGWNPYWINSIVELEWSIAVEMTFYLLVPILFMKIKSLQKSILFTFIVFILSNVIRFILNKYMIISDIRLWYEFMYLWFPNQLPVFCLGIVLYFILFDNGEIKFSIAFLLNKKKASILYFFISIYLLILSSTYDFQLLPKHFTFSISYLFLSISVAIYPLGIIVNRFWCFLGKLSFSIYLVHFAVLKVVVVISKHFIKVNLPIFQGLIVFFLTLAVTTAISYITFTIIELRFQNIGKKLICKLEQGSNIVHSNITKANTVK